MFFAKRLSALVGALTLLASVAEAEIDGRLAVAIGMPGSESFVFGTNLWAMGQIALLPKHGFALASKEVGADEDRLSLLQNARWKQPWSMAEYRMPMTTMFVLSWRSGLKA